MPSPAVDARRGTYRCQGCREYFRRPEYRRAGLGSVCSSQCLLAVAERKPAHPPQRQAPSGPSRATRVEVARRDRGRCRYCGTRRDLHLHHVNLRSHGVDHQPHNLISLCQRCHAKVHTDTRRYQPLLRAVIWCNYVEGTHLSVPQAQRLLS